MRPAGSDKAKRAPANARSGGLEALVPGGVGYGLALFLVLMHVLGCSVARTDYRSSPGL